MHSERLAAEWFVSNRLTTTRLRRVKPEED
jgi:hypothetical protein